MKVSYKLRTALLIVVFLLLLLILPIVFFSTHQKKTTIPPVKNQPSATPNTSSTLSINSVDPLPNGINASITNTLTVTFSRSLTTDEQAQVKATMTPSILLIASWSTDGSILTLQPSNLLDPATRYQISLVYPNNSFFWNFTTAAIENLSEKDQQILQDRADQAFGKKDQAILNAYPWYQEFPITTDDYFLYFDLQQKQFVAHLHPDSSKPIPYNTQIENYKNEVINELKSLGIDPAQYPISWQLFPK